MKLKLSIHRYMIIYVLAMFTFTTKAQTKNQKENDYIITGTVIDSITKTSIPYATAVLKSQENNKVIKGEVTNDNGQFKLTSKSNIVYLEISFMGYETKTIKNLKFLDNHCNLSTIHLKSQNIEMDEVVIRAEKSSVQYKLDKKVFNVGKDLVSAGGNTMDILNNVPSVNVDIEGNITLRGNSGVQILINGKPSVLTDQKSNALGTLTADMIESVEVITNPSAKYEAGGTAGILNIVLKKDSKKGLNGSVSINTGTPANHSLGLSLNNRTEKFNFFTPNRNRI